ncbi:MAG: phosphatase PAP2 family protein [Thermoplasmata archaeon]
MKMDLDDRFLFVFSLICFLVLTLLVANNFLKEIDRQIFLFIFEASQGTLYCFMKYITYIGDALFVLPVTVVIMYFFYRVKEKTLSIYFGIMMCVSLVSTSALKYLIKRPRPQVEVSVPDIHSIYSYPSGHTVGVFVLFLGFYVFFWILYKQETNISILSFSIIIAAVVSFSRIVLGHHYLTDVIGGVLLAILVINSTKIAVKKDSNINNGSSFSLSEGTSDI